LVKLGSALTESIKSDATTDLVVTVGDAGIDAAISSGATSGLKGFPPASAPKT
jgi:glutamine phosphoribosylpyrophosphate amidotransferase